MFDLTSDEYARDYEEVKRIGRCDAEQRGDRTPEQTLIARYFPAGGAPGSGVARDIVAQNGLDAEYDLWELAQLHALLEIAQHDALVSVFDTKYFYKFWRPSPPSGRGTTTATPPLPAIRTGCRSSPRRPIPTTRAGCRRPRERRRK